MTVPEGVQTYAGRLDTFKDAHHAPKRRASSTKKRGQPALAWPDTAPPAEEVTRSYVDDVREEESC
ncbi:MAG: hypothetical protein INR71_10120 [Terriglobus roseus]|nr:hypothetical protein [Terriglobus roseus]